MRSLLIRRISFANFCPHSHLLSVPAGPQLLSDIILSSPVLQEEGGDSGAGPSGSGGGGNSFEFGVDPSMDPELAMVSIELTSHSISGSVLALSGGWLARTIGKFPFGPLTLI